jgi:enoyl-CoA hydratase/carnithine racemase
MTAMQIPAAKALALGIAQEVVKHDDLMKRALEVAEMIAGNSPDGVRATKAMGKLGLEKGWIGELRGSEPSVEG